MKKAKLFDGKDGKFIGGFVSEDVFFQVLKLSDWEGISVSEFLRRVISDYLEKLPVNNRT